MSRPVYSFVGCSGCVGCGAVVGMKGLKGAGCT